ncbi:MAG: hypothetical protein PHE61_08595, partial [Candidatus Omnitrophica bacterium]|nr:hypothetical protein [Candidatus Omnitrophota bacterium]
AKENWAYHFSVSALKVFGVTFGATSTLPSFKEKTSAEAASEATKYPYLERDKNTGVPVKPARVRLELGIEPKEELGRAIDTLAGQGNLYGSKFDIEVKQTPDVKSTVYDPYSPLSLKDNIRIAGDEGDSRLFGVDRMSPEKLRLRIEAAKRLILRRARLMRAAYEYYREGRNIFHDAKLRLDLAIQLYGDDGTKIDSAEDAVFKAGEELKKAKVNFENARGLFLGSLRIDKGVLVNYLTADEKAKLLELTGLDNAAILDIQNTLARGEKIEGGDYGRVESKLEEAVVAAVPEERTRFLAKVNGVSLEELLKFFGGKSDARFRKDLADSAAPEALLALVDAGLIDANAVRARSGEIVSIGKAADIVALKRAGLIDVNVLDNGSKAILARIENDAKEGRLVVTKDYGKATEQQLAALKESRERSKYIKEGHLARLFQEMLDRKKALDSASGNLEIIKTLNEYEGAVDELAAFLAARGILYADLNALVSAVATEQKLPSVVKPGSTVIAEKEAVAVRSDTEEQQYGKVKSDLENYIYRYLMKGEANFEGFTNYFSGKACWISSNVAELFVRAHEKGIRERAISFFNCIAESAGNETDKRVIKSVSEEIEKDEERVWRVLRYDLAGKSYETPEGLKGLLKDLRPNGVSENEWADTCTRLGLSNPNPAMWRLLRVQIGDEELKRAALNEAIRRFCGEFAKDVVKFANSFKVSGPFGVGNELAEDAKATLEQTGAIKINEDTFGVSKAHELLTSIFADIVKDYKLKNFPMEEKVAGGKAQAKPQQTVAKKEKAPKAEYQDLDTRRIFELAVKGGRLDVPERDIRRAVLRGIIETAQDKPKIDLVAVIGFGPSGVRAGGGVEISQIWLLNPTGDVRKHIVKQYPEFAKIFLSKEVQRFIHEIYSIQTEMTASLEELEFLNKTIANLEGAVAASKKRSDYFIETDGQRLNTLYARKQEIQNRIENIEKQIKLLIYADPNESVSFSKDVKAWRLFNVTREDVSKMDPASRDEAVRMAKELARQCSFEGRKDGEKLLAKYGGVIYGEGSLEILEAKKRADMAALDLAFHRAQDKLHIRMSAALVAPQPSFNVEIFKYPDVDPGAALPPALQALRELDSVMRETRFALVQNGRDILHEIRNLENLNRILNGAEDTPGALEVYDKVSARYENGLEDYGSVRRAREKVLQL